jgi:hypothetical protein
METSEMFSATVVTKGGDIGKDHGRNQVEMLDEDLKMSFTTIPVSAVRQHAIDLPLRLSPSPQTIRSSSSTPLASSPTTTTVMAPRPSRSGSSSGIPTGPRQALVTNRFTKTWKSPALHSMDNFLNESLIQQKRLKANTSQINMAAKDFMSLKLGYIAFFSVPPITTCADRAQKYEKLRSLCARYERLLEVRRDILEKQQEWLEEAVGTPGLKESVQLEMAIDTQIVAAKELATLQEEGKLRRELEALMHQS